MINQHSLKSSYHCPAHHLVTRFIQRMDIHALQLEDGRYICVHEPLEMSHVYAHLLGDRTLGIYLLDPDSKAQFVVIDADDDGGFSRLMSLAKGLVSDNVPSYVEESRRGGHLWMFFDRSFFGKRARAFAKGVLAVHHIEDVEVFPKQDELAGGPGSLIRMPFGMHRLSGIRYRFYTPDGEPLAPTVFEQIQILSSPKTVSVSAFKNYENYQSPHLNNSCQPSKVKSQDMLTDQIKRSITVIDFVGQYVDLKPTGYGAIGLCPFHDDHKPSFGVNNKENYWHCFAGCGGGSIIDFWMKWKGCDFTEAVTELAEMLL